MTWQNEGGDGRTGPSSPAPGGNPPEPPQPGIRGAHDSPPYPPASAAYRPNGAWTNDPSRPGSPPLGNRPLRPVDIQSYAAPKLTRSWLLWLLAAAVLAGIVLGATVLNRPPASAPGDTPSSPVTAPTSAGPGLPFTMPYNPEAGGRWEVLAQEWTTGGVLLRVRLFADRGTISYGFLAFENNGVDVVRPDTSPKSPELTRGSMSAGETETGYVFFPIERGPATLILTTSGGRQISALPITG